MLKLIVTPSYSHFDATHKKTRATMIHGRSSMEAAVSNDVCCDSPEKKNQTTVISHSYDIALELTIKVL